ncbi:type II toxin-antitoxin system VapC family toxin [Inquilinus sp. YAF38]|uniref:type II toxin-antitoxin system VapC family toxin n=1 Tax=Inquilinus sp. YAF38 TaxID=3233084 RepID=UPI003F92DB33
MILVDTSVWIDHLRSADDVLAHLLDVGQVLMHPFIVGELALGSLHQRDLILQTLLDLQQADVATEQEVLHFIARHVLFGRGIGYVDAHLLASVKLTAGISLWTRDKRLLAVAEQLGMAARPV